MTTIWYEHDADLSALRDETIAVVGYGNQGRSWALNLRDGGFDVRVHVRADESRVVAERDGFDPGAVDTAGDASVVCLLTPDDVIPLLGVQPRHDSLVVVASGYSLAFSGFDPACDVGMLAPRMLGPEVRATYLEGTGFISAVGVHRDDTGTARRRLLALAQALGGLRQGAIELSPRQEAILDLATEQLLAPALKRVNTAFAQVLVESGIPVEAILCELFFSGEVERSFRRMRLEGYAAQMEHHSPVSQYGQLSREHRYDSLDFVPPMREVLAEIGDGRFAAEWDAERDSGHPSLAALKDAAAGPALAAWERELRRRLGEGVPPGGPPPDQ